jgi:uncharacterized protein YyaL (SSP411 family)
VRARAALALAVLAAGSPWAPRAAAEDPVTKAGPPPARTNRLATERSPYLRQHMHNPVDWWPWGPEAFAKAKERDVPVFLSVGYAACHWCHVMEHESFEDAATAALLNEAFVCVKVDREERPDVDDVYMTAIQVTTGRGGWPMTCVLTPDGRPFVALTYLPRAALQDLARRVRSTWTGQRARVEAAADDVASAVRASAAGIDLPAVPGSDAEIVASAVERLRADFDPVHGGFDRVPKFPPHAALLLLLDRGGAVGGEAGLSMARRTLDAMASGGIRDHVGGGFHRYSTDAVWLLPHFEKMLYDNALLARAYLEAHAIDREPRWARVARSTLDWVVREMSVEGGGYASSLDADTEGHEGLTYTWTVDELAEALGKEDGALAARAFGARPEGNYDEEATRRPAGRNVLHLALPVADLAESLGLPAAHLGPRLDGLRGRLLAARAKRSQPGRDGKVVTAWNGLLLGAFARAGTVLGDAAWTERARDLARFLLRASRDGGRLLRFPKASGPTIPGFLDDHAHLADGLLDLAEATGEPGWADEAATLAGALLAGFAAPGGGFHSTSTAHEALLARPRTPSTRRSRPGTRRRRGCSCASPRGPARSAGRRRATPPSRRTARSRPARRRGRRRSSACSPTARRSPPRAPSRSRPTSACGGAPRRWTSSSSAGRRGPARACASWSAWPSTRAGT